MRPSDVILHRRMLVERYRELASSRRVDDVGDKEEWEWDEMLAVADRVSDADVYYVTAEMTEVALAAARTMPRVPLRRQDVPSSSGFMVWDAPIGSASLTNSDIPADTDVPVRGVAWFVYKEFEVEEGIFSSLPEDEYDLDNPDPETDLACMRNSVQLIPLGDVSSMSTFYELAPLQGVKDPLWWQVDGDAGDDGDIANDSGLRGRTSYRIVTPIHATWLLMQQLVSATEKVRADRPERRRSSRAGLVSDLLVVRLRRTAKTVSGQDDQGGVDWSHRWMVSGHWRNQWYPSAGGNRPIWVSPYVKGPSDKPLVVKEKITVWER